MDLDGYNTVISKFEKALTLMKDGTVKSNDLNKRLGDLYAEKARLTFLEEMKAQSKNNNLSRKQRLTAIQYYERSLKHTRDKDRLPMILQIGHLNQIIGRPKTARKQYWRLLKESQKYRAKMFIGLAYYGIAEIDFTSGKYKLALEGFQKSLKGIPSSMHPMAYYRIAWSQMNSGRAKKGTNTLIKILKTASLLEKDGAYNRPFHEDVSRDFITFIARKPVYNSHVELVVQLSPDHLKKENIYNLAVETERTGQWASAVRVWGHYLNEKIPQQRDIEAKVRLAQSLYFLGQPLQASKQFKSALKAWSDSDCNDSRCKETKGRFKNFIVHWEKDSRDKVDVAFADTINDYLKVFESDPGVFYIAAVQNRKAKKHKTAVALYASAIKKSENNKKLRSSALSDMIETAEDSKNDKLRRDTYNTYLEFEPSSKKSIEVKYQIAHLDYKEKRYKSATERFHTIVEMKDAPLSLKTKSADLGLDILAIQKRHELLEERALNYSTRIKNRRKEFKIIARTACFNLANQRIQNKDAKDNDLKEPLDRLRTYSFADLNTSTKVKYHKLQIALALRIQNLNEVKRASRKIIALRGVRTRDLDFARANLQLVYELELKFYSAYKTFKAIDNHGMSRADRELKLGMLAELANIESSKHYENFIKYTPSRKKANSVRSHLAMRSKNPWTRIDKDFNKLLYTPDQLADLGLEAYAKRPSRKHVEKLLKYKRVRNSAYGQILQREILLADLLTFKRKVDRHKISSANQYLINKGIERRIELINESEGFIKNSSRTGDILYQAYVLDFVGELYKRTASELKKLPVPNGLSSKERSRYKDQLAEKVVPYEERSNKLMEKSEDLWDRNNEFKMVKSLYKNSTKNQRSVIAGQLKHFEKSSPYSFKRASKDLRSEKEPFANISLSSVWAELKKEPLETENVRRLQSYMEYHNLSTLHSYLDLRLIQIKGVTNE
tara:strand:+ start:137069 stop:139930 length:2862 start_codon:yes stop_codon:yes gene_type:complete